jgi:hypothetical protein
MKIQGQGQGQPGHNWGTLTGAWNSPQSRHSETQTGFGSDLDSDSGSDSDSDSGSGSDSDSDSGSDLDSDSDSGSGSDLDSDSDFGSLLDSHLACKEKIDFLVLVLILVRN